MAFAGGGLDGDSTTGDMGSPLHGTAPVLPAPTSHHSSLLLGCAPAPPTQPQHWGPTAQHCRVSYRAVLPQHMLRMSLLFFFSFICK